MQRWLHQRENTDYVGAGRQRNRLHLGVSPRWERAWLVGMCA